MYELKLAWRNLVNRPVQTLVTLTVVALAVALAVTAIHLNEGLQRGIIRASDPFGVLVVGAKGSSQQLVLSTLLLQGTPVGNIDGHVFEELRNDPRVALAVPIAMGDNIGGARIIGTDEHFFELRSSQQAPPAFQLAEGRLFEADFEAVLGSRAAAALGLRIGDQFRPAHGVEPGLEGDEHAELHTIVGILRPSDTPFDNAVFTTVNSVIQIHAEAAPEAPVSADSAAMDAHAEETDHDATDSAAVATVAETARHEESEHADDAHAVDEHEERGEAEAHDDHDHAIKGQVTAVLVAPVGFIEANQLWREFYTGTEAQAVFPGRELGGLFDLLNQGQEILIAVGYLAAIMAALTLFLAIYSATESRQHLLAILRGVGASRRTVMLVVLVETVLVAMLGALLGRLLGYGAATAIAGEISRRSAIPIVLGWLPQVEPALWLLPLALGVLAGLLPAWQAYRVNVVEKLFPS
jgi:putative ABC transport system permease protein